MAGLPHHPYRLQAVVMALITWLVLAWVILMVDPTFIQDVGWKFSYAPFLLMIFAAVGLTFWSFTGRWKQAGLWTAIITTSVWLRINQLDSVINTVLLIAFGFVWEYYWRLSKTNSLIN
jgi:hypothetical protein